MFNIPEHYKTDVKLALKDFIPKGLKADDKKRIRGSLREARLMYQIAGEEIPSVISDEYNCQVIQFYEMEVQNIKDAAYLAAMYQGLIKPLCVIWLHDSRKELYSLAIKRLNQTDDTKIIIENSILTEEYPIGLSDVGRDRFIEYLDYARIKNRSNKVNLYKEWCYRTYLLMNEKAYANTEGILEGNDWYDSDQMERVYLYFKKLVDTRRMLKKASFNSEKINLNKEIKKVIRTLDEEVTTIHK